MKKKILIIFGGMSSEHEVSCSSAVNVIRSLDRDRFIPVIIGITKSGKWLSVDSDMDILDGTWEFGRRRAVLSPDSCDRSVIFFDDESGEIVRARVDCAFPVLHGKYGEDGTIQGLFELAGLPYVGSGVLSSSICMDKFYTKIIAGELGIRQASYIKAYPADAEKVDALDRKIREDFGYPVFVKPSNAGSSCGVSKVMDVSGLGAALAAAAEIDRKILIEEAIAGREIECAVFGGGCDEVRVLGIGEILSASEYYDYDSKYNNPASQTITSPDIPESSAEVIRDEAEKLYKAADCCSLARVDFFVKEDGEVVFNEINTIPGFTNISMYPKIAEAAGIDHKTLITMLIENGAGTVR